MAVNTRELSLASSVTVQGGGGVGKEEFAGNIAPRLGKYVLPTGLLPRYAAMFALAKNLFEKEDGRTVFGPRGFEALADWFGSDSRRVHFEIVRKDVAAHLFVGGKDVTHAILPQQTGVTRQGTLEPAASALAANPNVVRMFIPIWRKAIYETGGPVVVTRRNPDHFVPEAHKKFLLVARLNEAAEYRRRRGVAATGSVGQEMKWLRDRDNVEKANGLMGTAAGAIFINTTPFLLVRGGRGMDRLAEREAEKMKHELPGVLNG